MLQMQQIGAYTTGHTSAAWCIITQKKRTFALFWGNYKSIYNCKKAGWKRDLGQLWEAAGSGKLALFWGRVGRGAAVRRGAAHGMGVAWLALRRLSQGLRGVARRRCAGGVVGVLGAIRRDFFGATCGAWAARRDKYDGMTRAEALVLLGFLRGGCGKPLFYRGLRVASAPEALFYLVRRV